MLKTTSTTLSIPIPTDSKMEYSSISCSSSDPTVPENGMMLFSLSDNSEITLDGNTAITINITLNGFNYIYEITLTDVTSYKTNRTRIKLPSEYKHPELINLGYETIYESLFKEPQSFDSVTPSSDYTGGIIKGCLCSNNQLYRITDTSTCNGPGYILDTDPYVGSNEPVYGNITCLGDDSNVDDNVNVTENISYEEMGHGLCSDASDGVISHVIIPGPKRENPFTKYGQRDRERYASAICNEVPECLGYSLETDEKDPNVTSTISQRYLTSLYTSYDNSEETNDSSNTCSGSYGEKYGNKLLDVTSKDECNFAANRNNQINTYSLPSGSGIIEKCVTNVGFFDTLETSGNMSSPNHKLVCREKPLQVYDYVNNNQTCEDSLGQLSGLPLESVSTYEECQSSGTGISGGELGGEGMLYPVVETNFDNNKNIDSLEYSKLTSFSSTTTLDTIMGNTHSQELTLTDSTNTLYDYNCYINILDNTTQWDTNTNINTNTNPNTIKKICKTKYNTTSFKRIETNTSCNDNSYSDINNVKECKAAAYINPKVRWDTAVNGETGISDTNYPKGCFIDKDTDFVYFNDINEELIQSDNHERICYDSKDYLEDQILLYVDGTISKTNDDLTIDGSNGPNSLEVNDKLTPPGIEINLHHNETIFEEIITGEKIDQTARPSPYKINNSDGDLLFPSDVITSDDKIEYCRNIVTDNSNNYVGFSYLGSSSGDEECQLFENDYLDTTNGVPFTTSESNSETRYYNVGTNDEHLLKYKNTTSTSSTIESTQPITYTSGITGSDHPQYDWNNMIVKPTKHHKCYKKNSTTEKLHTQSPLCYGIDSNEVDSNSNYYSILNNSCGGDFMIPDDEECEKAVSILYPEAVYDSSNAVVTGSCIVTIPDKDGILDGDIYPKWTYGSTPPVGTDYYSLCKKSTSDNFGSSESHNTHLTWKMFTEDISLPSCGDCNEELVTTTSDTNSNYNKLEDVCNGYNTQCVFRGGSAETQCYDTNSIPQDESTLLKSQSNCSLGSDVELESISVNTGSSGEGYNFVGTLSTTSTTTIGDYLETIDKSNQLVYTGRNIGNTIYINIFDKTGNLITDPTDPAVTNVPINMNRYSSDCLIYDPYGTLPDKIDLDFSEVRPGWINPNISVVDNTDSTSGLNIYETTLGWGSIDPSNFGTKGCGPKWIEGQWRKVTFDANTNIINEVHYHMNPERWCSTIITR